MDGTTLQDVKRIESAEGHAPGVYRGEWTGYRVYWETDFGAYEAKAARGIRGTAPCTVTVTERGNFFVRVTE